MRRFAIVVAVLACVSVVRIEAQAARGSVGQVPEVQAALSVLDAWIASLQTQQELPGLSIGIVIDQDLVWAKGYGHADVARRIPATPATLYRIASITKLFTATAVMQLRDAGKLQLDDPILRHLPSFSIETTYKGGPPVTIRHLLTHTSGLPRDVGVSFSEPTFPAPGDLVALGSRESTVRPSEVAWVYSNFAMSLAGEIVALVSGEPWEAYVRRHIIQPLGMTATQTVPRRELSGLAVGYSQRVAGKAREVEPFVDVGAYAPAGGMTSSVDDLATFVSLQFRDGPVQGNQVLQGSTLREMHRVQWLADDWQRGQGLGFLIQRSGDHVRISHGGSLPGHATQVAMEPLMKLGIIVLTNANDGNPGRIVDQAFDLVGSALKKTEASTERAPVAPAAWQAYVGAYVSPACATCAYKFSEMQILVLNGELTMIEPGADNPWTSRLVLKPVKDHTFTITSPGFSYAAVGEALTFEVDREGKVTRVRTPAFSWLPKK